jgi:hypothetical protein
MTKMLGLPNVPVSIDFQDATDEEWEKIKEEFRRESSSVESKEIPKKVVKFKKRGHMPGLAKHLAKKYGGDPHFFTKCMGAEEISSYDEDAKKAICAKAHKLVTGIWPGQHKKKELTFVLDKDLLKKDITSLVS